MNLKPGTYNLGPIDGTVQVKTGRQGMTATPDGRLAGSLTVVQSEFGIKPFSAMMGALKVKDEVEVNLDVALPGGSSS